MWHILHKGILTDIHESVFVTKQTGTINQLNSFMTCLAKLMFLMDSYQIYSIFSSYQQRFLEIQVFTDDHQSQKLIFWLTEFSRHVQYPNSEINCRFAITHRCQPYRFSASINSVDKKLIHYHSMTCFVYGYWSRAPTFCLHDSTFPLISIRPNYVTYETLTSTRLKSFPCN